MKVQGRRKIGRHKRRCLDRVRDDIEEKGPSARRRCMIVLHGGYAIVYRPHIKMGIIFHKSRASSVVCLHYFSLFLI